MVSTITNCWEQDLKIIPNWDTIGGEILFRKYVEINDICGFRELLTQAVTVHSHIASSITYFVIFRMFELEPECIRMFGFPSDTKFDDPALSTNDKFIKKGTTFIAMLDIALTLLGPNLAPLEAELVKLGGRHVARQCKPKHWPMVGVALFYTLEMLLGYKFTKEVQDCWIVLYNFLGYHMIQGLIQNGGPTWEDNEIALAAIAAADLPTKELPYAKYVNLTPEQRKFHCQTPVIAHDIKFSMVSTITNCWEQDLKIIPNWDKIGGDCSLTHCFLHHLLCYF
jgi:hemoglobin-like flavoprotein